MRDIAYVSPNSSNVSPIPATANSTQHLATWNTTNAQRWTYPRHVTKQYRIGALQFKQQWAPAASKNTSAALLLTMSNKQGYAKQRVDETTKLDKIVRGKGNSAIQHRQKHAMNGYKCTTSHPSLPRRSSWQGEQSHNARASDEMQHNCAAAK